MALATVLTFLPVLGNGWVDWDDELAFLTNPHFRGLGFEQLRWMWTSLDVGIYRPLTWMTLGADFLGHFTLVLTPDPTLPKID